MSDPKSSAFQEWNPAPKRPVGTDLAARLMDDMDPEVLEFLKTSVNSFIKWDLVIFYSENPNTTDTATNVSRYIGRDLSVTESEMDELVQSKVLQRDRVSDLTVYSLTIDQAMRDRIKHFVAVANDVQFRGKVFYHLIRGLR
ncbi:MAG TPA: hypothetical protein VFF70_11290 [Anaerolineae bacterium]|nr:hypothetical protein [Anaerolineae bacterium]